MQAGNLRLTHTGFSPIRFVARCSSDLVKQGRVSASPIAELFVTWLVARPKSRPLGVADERFHDILYEFSRKLVAKGIWQEA